MIHVDNLTKYYNGLCAVDQINLDIKKGEILGLLGPNGAGKTTTLRMLTGFLKPSSGGIEIKDFNINENLLEIKKLIGYLPESAPMYHDMIVYDYLDYIANIREIPKDEKFSRIRKLADICGLNEVMHKTLDVLSKGYKQRVGLAHAMISDPEVLILDEPTSGLDPNQIVEIRKIIRKIGKEKTIILSTHILSEAEAACDRIVIINQGKIVADGSTETLRNAAGNKIMIHLALENADVESAKTQLSLIDGVEDVQPQDMDNGTLNIKLACKSLPQMRRKIYEKIKMSDWIMLEFYQDKKSLESIFRQLTQEN